MSRRKSAPDLCAIEPQKDIRYLGASEKIFDLYQWTEVLQEDGDGGKVVVCQAKQPGGPGNPAVAGPKLVLKMRSKESLRENNMEEQFRHVQLRILNIPPHVGVLPLREVLEDQKFYYIVMEKASGGSFFDGLMQEFPDGVMPPHAVKRLMREILEAIGHVHKQGMLHRDIKPDNIVMQDLEGPPAPSCKTRRAALIDFDHAEVELDQKGALECGSFCGTIRYSAPETFLGHFSFSSDLYSVGVILYLLMTGKMPYDDDVYEEVMHRPHWRGAVAQRMKMARLDWRCNPWPEQQLCRNLCQRLLAFERLARFATAEDALKHEWFS